MVTYNKISLQLGLLKGPGTSESISPVSDYRKNWPSVKELDFVKDVSSDLKMDPINLYPRRLIDIVTCYTSDSK